MQTKYNSKEKYFSDDYMGPHVGSETVLGKEPTDIYSITSTHGALVAARSSVKIFDLKF